MLSLKSSVATQVLGDAAPNEVRDVTAAAAARAWLVELV